MYNDNKFQGGKESVRGFAKSRIRADPLVGRAKLRGLIELSFRCRRVLVLASLIFHRLQCVQFNKPGIVGCACTRVSESNRRNANGNFIPRNSLDEEESFLFPFSFRLMLRRAAMQIQFRDNARIQLEDAGTKMPVGKEVT